MIEYNPRRQKTETQRVERSLLLPRSMLFVLIMKETERYSQLTRLFNLRSLPVNWKNLLDTQATDVLSETGSLQSLSSNFDFPKNSKNWIFLTTYIRENFRTERMFKELVILLQESECLVLLLLHIVQFKEQLNWEWTAVTFRKTSMNDRYFTKYQMCIY
jgi:hypothetical protein